MKKHIIALSLIILVFSSCLENYTSIDYLKEVAKEMKKIESATFRVHVESWSHGGTEPNFEIDKYVESYRNTSDSIIGSSWVSFKAKDKSLFSAYDGKIRTLVYHDEKVVVIDSFKVRKCPFRTVTTPFFNYTENIIKYILKNNDSTLLVQQDLGEEVYLKLTIYEDKQVEFFGKACYMPKNPYILDPTSVYELWIDKKSNLPRKVRREMSHSISVRSVLDYEFNKLNIKDFVASNYFPENYKIREYGKKGKKTQPNKLIGKKAPNWVLKNSEKKNISLSNLKSKVLMIQFTSVGCGPCRASIPFLKELSTEYSKNNFDFVAIECSSKNTNVLKTYKKRYDFDYQFLLSTKDVLREYSIRSFPVFFILDQNRFVKKVIYGYGKEDTDKKIRRLINEMIKR